MRLIYVVSLLAVGGLWALAALPAFFSASPTAERFNPVQKVAILEREGGWILQIDLVNPVKETIPPNLTDLAKETVRYTIRVAVDGAPYVGEVNLLPSRTYSYTFFIYPQDLTEGRVTMAVYREGQEQPLEEATYFLKASGAPKGQR